MNRKILIVVVIIVILLIFFYKYQIIGEHFVLPFFMGNPSSLEDGIYVITNRLGGISERCLISDSDAYPRLSQFNDRLCGFKTTDDLLKDGKGVWIVKNISTPDVPNQYILASGYDDFNKCLLFPNMGKGEYPIKYSPNYASKSLCGIQGNLLGLRNSIGNMIWTINPVGGSSYTISNTSNNDVSNVWAGSSPSQGTSATNTPSDINSPTPAPISNMTTIPPKVCLAILDEIIPKRFIANENPSNVMTCGFTDYSRLVNDSRAVWNFYKVSGLER